MCRVCVLCVTCSLVVLPSPTRPIWNPARPTTGIKTITPTSSNINLIHTELKIEHTHMYSSTVSNIGSLRLIYSTVGSLRLIYSTVSNIGSLKFQTLVNTNTYAVVRTHWPHTYRPLRKAQTNKQKTIQVSRQAGYSTMTLRRSWRLIHMESRPQANPLRMNTLRETMK